MNQITKLLGISFPIIQGGMGNISNAPLAAAVSNAGGLGMIGAGTMTPKEVEKIIVETKELTEKPFGVNIAISVNPHVKELVGLVIKHGIKVISLSAGNPAPMIPILKENGVKILCVVATVLHAQKAEAAGADMVVAEGYEAAGINSSLETTTFALIPQVVQGVSIPVIAAGGIGDGHGLAAALMLGASGVQMGTRFIATKEAPFHENYKQKMLECNDHGTVVIGRTVGKIRRLLPSLYIEKVLQKEKEGMSVQEYADMTTEHYHVNGAIHGNMKDGFVNGGQIAGLVSDVPTVEELLTNMMKEAKNRIAVVSGMFH
ncbi:NAD(P)H-dependent flavin oxidoreductase [Peribacillus acanthi]|uniref:NAD(P)H-dependent flavin oxidoreductase n=1 Tax=Peribacillus acanthi TaxID=2171554 RepID=UPI000D3EDF52|nr:nitronate monooxygenase [Peribacillus acanthi]